MQILTREHAVQIEQDLSLSPGDIASNRKMTMAEWNYFKAPQNLTLGVVVDYLGADPALLLFEQGIVGPDVKDYLKGSAYETHKEALDDVIAHWEALVMARAQSQEPILGERVALSFTGWSEGSRQEWTWSLAPSPRMQIIHGANRSVVLGPQLRDLPAEYEGGLSPGRCIHRLLLDQVLWFHRLRLEGTTFQTSYEARDFLFSVKKGLYEQRSGS